MAFGAVIETMVLTLLFISPVILLAILKALVWTWGKLQPSRDVELGAGAWEEPELEQGSGVPADYKHALQQLGKAAVN